MTSIIKFKKQYFILAILIFVIEVLIAKYVHDKIIRPYIGDVLVVILIYCFFKSFLNKSVITIAISTLIFSYLIETLQYFNIVNLLSLQNSKLARTIIGTSFSWKDILAYTAGIILVLVVEKLFSNNIYKSK